MNERIRELALKARLDPVLKLHYWGSKIDALTDLEQKELKCIEEFAELIVRECAMIARSTKREADVDGGAVMRKHFGVDK